MSIRDPLGIHSQNLEERQWMHNKLFSHFYTRGIKSTNHTSTQLSTQQDDIPILLTQARPDISAYANIITQALIKKLSSILSAEIENLEEHRPLHAYGINYLVAGHKLNFKVTYISIFN